MPFALVIRLVALILAAFVVAAVASAPALADAAFRSCGAVKIRGFYTVPVAADKLRCPKARSIARGWFVRPGRNVIIDGFGCRWDTGPANRVTCTRGGTTVRFNALD